MVPIPVPHGEAQPAREAKTEFEITKPGLSRLKYAVYVIREDRSYDEVLGDLTVSGGDPEVVLHRTHDQAYGDAPMGNGDPTLVRYGLRETPNAHKLARDFVILDDFRCQGESWAEGRSWCESACPLADKPAAGLVELCRRRHVACAQYGDKETGSNGDVAEAFVRDLGNAERSGEFPRLTVVSLPEESEAASDAAIGRIAEAVSHSKIWPDTVVFVADAAVVGKDHVDGRRGVCLVASPYAARGTVDGNRYTSVSVVRTIELILGLPPMTRYDAQATPMFSCFTDRPDFTPFDAARP
jgi:hypothetical protein